jgi:hypothetical protein
LQVRLYPTLLSGLPFSTDAWSPIRNTELILKHTPVKLDSGILDNYNCYWPANSIFGASISIITGMKPMDAMRIFIPIFRINDSSDLLCFGEENQQELQCSMPFISFSGNSLLICFFHSWSDEGDVCKPHLHALNPVFP